MEKILKNKKGISILEVVVAILIITIGMVGVMSLVIQNIQAQYINKNILIASGLAQEGLELVRNVRDLNWLTPGNTWNQDIIWNQDNVGDGTYAIDYRGRSSINNITVNYISDAGARLYINNSTGLYTHTAAGATPTNFYRLITAEVSHAEYIDVKCTINWLEGNQNHNYTAETYLYNWR